jgi:putative membrane protein insertion efficiency factor
MARYRDALRFLLRIPGLLLIGLVRLYQWTISPLLGRRCRFEPSCSEYFIGSVRKYGAIRGTLRGVWRICRCNPWNPGGYDPP